MPQQTDPAVPKKLFSLNESLVGQKLRVAGRMLSYDAITCLVLVLDRNAAVLVDVSLCVDPWSSSWVRERLGVITIIGHLESSPTQLPIPTIPAYAPAPTIDPHIVLRALLVMPTTDLDLDLWNLAIEEGETFRLDLPSATV